MAKEKKEKKNCKQKNCTADAAGGRDYCAGHGKDTKPKKEDQEE